MPKISEIEPTPNPNAMKFVLKEPLTWGVSRSYDSAQQAEQAEQADDRELASALFAIPHVTNVFYVDRWITVTQDGGASWPELLRELAQPIREAPAAQVRSEAIAQAAALDSDDIDESAMSAEDRAKLRRITDILDERVRPYLQGDGGDLYVVGLVGKELQVHYQGACGSCPSSLAGTLSGIESMVREIDPEMVVVPV